MQHLSEVKYNLMLSFKGATKHGTTAHGEPRVFRRINSIRRITYMRRSSRVMCYMSDVHNMMLHADVTVWSGAGQVLLTAQPQPLEPNCLWGPLYRTRSQWLLPCPEVGAGTRLWGLTGGWTPHVCGEGLHARETSFGFIAGPSSGTCLTVADLFPRPLWIELAGRGWDPQAQRPDWWKAPQPRATCWANCRWDSEHHGLSAVILLSLQAFAFPSQHLGRVQTQISGAYSMPSLNRNFWRDSCWSSFQNFRDKRKALNAGIYLAYGAEGMDGTLNTLTFISSKGNSGPPSNFKRINALKV